MKFTRNFRLEVREGLRGGLCKSMFLRILYFLLKKIEIDKRIFMNYSSNFDKKEIYYKKNTQNIFL